MTARIRGNAVSKVVFYLDGRRLRTVRRADRTGIGRAIGMAAHRRIDRAMVEAGAATDAAERLPRFGVGEHGEDLPALARGRLISRVYADGEPSVRLVRQRHSSRNRLMLISAPPMPAATNAVTLMLSLSV